MTRTEAISDDNYRLDDQVGYLLRLAHQRHTAIFQSNAIAELTPTQFAALARLAERKRCSQNQLGRYAAMDIATIKGVVDRLKQKGLVKTEQSKEDKRRVMVTLSEKGSSLIAELHGSGKLITEETLKPLTATERKELLKLLRKLT